MKRFSVIFLFIYLLFSSLHQAMALKCRTGNQQSDDQFQKIMQICRRRSMGNDRENGRGYNDRDTDSQESSDSESEEDLFDNKFLSSGANGNRYRGNGNGNGNGRYEYAASSPVSRNMTRQSSSVRNWSNRSYAPDGSRSSTDYGQTNTNRRSMRNSGIDSRGYGDTGYSNRYNNNNKNSNNNDKNRYNYNDNGDDGGNNNKGEREQACITQCFFNELNLVDQRGYPEISAVTNVMLKNIPDPELRDFIEESVMECFHYLNNNGRQEKCQFSQNLLSCLAEKGSERCEDWDDD